MAELPPVLTMRALLAYANLGVPKTAPGRIDRKRMRRWLAEKGLPMRVVAFAEDGTEIWVPATSWSLASLERQWPDLVEALRARLARETADSTDLRRYG